MFYVFNIFGGSLYFSQHHLIFFKYSWNFRSFGVNSNLVNNLLWFSSWLLKEVFVPALCSLKKEKIILRPEILQPAASKGITMSRKNRWIHPSQWVFVHKHQLLFEIRSCIQHFLSMFALWPYYRPGERCFQKAILNSNISPLHWL